MNKKTVILIRHAKSSWDNALQKDFDRPLNERGHHDAVAMAKQLYKKGIGIDAFISSPAKRALNTCQYFAEKFQRKYKDIIQVPQLYEPTEPSFFNVIRQLDNEFDSVAIFSHNPGITAFANRLTEIRIDDMPTCAIFAMQAEISDWLAFQEAKKKFLFFDYPKMHS